MESTDCISLRDILYESGIGLPIWKLFLIGGYTIRLYYYLKQVTTTLYISGNEQNHHINKE